MNDQARWNEGKILGISNTYWQGTALQTGVTLDVFTMLGEGKLTAKQLARRSGYNVRALEMLLNALCAMGLLIKEGDRYKNTEESRTFLSRDSERYLGYIISHHFHLMRRWAHLPDVVRTGQPVHSGPPETEEQREAFLMGMFNMASLIAPKVARVIDLSDRQTLLDLGGGPGTYAVHFCLANSSLKATVYDLPATEPYAQKTIKAYGLSHRVSFQAGNYVEQDLAGVYDVVWMSHILHAMGPRMCQEVIGKAVSIMMPGGILYVHDFLLNENRDGPLFPAIFSLNMLVNTRDGRSYSEVEISSMLKEAGLREIKRIPFETLNSSGILCGRL